ncbi:Phosphoenolpyruvate carboxylase [Actinidia chinensis var. chinensis]|uniref:Phosphoenolpyruvate carboxylase n=1 Tax=Actinidia chinensis var. chinensis TaxID=1590841 RepID=A0A2R6QGL8_ACTCC|nr:Phosphoenolpyruvate carboxylase [Actinidia chinensis var. chinensis]
MNYEEVEDILLSDPTAHEIGDKEPAQASTVTEALVPMVMASTDQVLDFMGSRHVLAFGSLVISMRQPSASPSFLAIQINRYYGRRQGIIDGKVLYQVCTVFIHDPNLFGDFMHLTVEALKIRSLAGLSHRACSILKRTAGTWSRQQTAMQVHKELRIIVPTYDAKLLW